MEILLDPRLRQLRTALIPHNGTPLAASESCSMLNAGAHSEDNNSVSRTSSTENSHAGENIAKHAKQTVHVHSAYFNGP